MRRTIESWPLPTPVGLLPPHEAGLHGEPVPEPFSDVKRLVHDYSMRHQGL
jgi:hypothetical protein